LTHARIGADVGGKHYGIVVREDGTTDPDETAKLRTRLRAERKEEVA
jgi:hypothetical protein